MQFELILKDFEPRLKTIQNIIVAVILSHQNQGRTGRIKPNLCQLLTQQPRTRHNQQMKLFAIFTPKKFQIETRKRKKVSSTCKVWQKPQPP